MTRHVASSTLPGCWQSSRKAADDPTQKRDEARFRSFARPLSAQPKLCRIAIMPPRRGPPARANKPIESFAESVKRELVNPECVWTSANCPRACLSSRRTRTPLEAGERPTLERTGRADCLRLLPGGTFVIMAQATPVMRARLIATRLRPDPD